MGLKNHSKSQVYETRSFQVQLQAGRRFSLRRGPEIPRRQMRPDRVGPARPGLVLRPGREARRARVEVSDGLSDRLRGVAVDRLERVDLPLRPPAVQHDEDEVNKTVRAGGDGGANLQKSRSTLKQVRLLQRGFAFSRN